MQRNLHCTDALTTDNGYSGEPERGNRALRTIAPSYEESLVKLRVELLSVGQLLGMVNLPRALAREEVRGAGVARGRSGLVRGRPRNHLLSVPGLRAIETGQPHSAFAVTAQIDQ
jgi:hypothetical protein